jgi:hypothetical protein
VRSPMLEKAKTTQVGKKWYRYAKIN